MCRRLHAMLQHILVLSDVRCGHAMGRFSVLLHGRKLWFRRVAVPPLHRCRGGTNPATEEEETMAGAFCAVGRKFHSAQLQHLAESFARPNFIWRLTALTSAPRQFCRSSPHQSRSRPCIAARAGRTPPRRRREEETVAGAFGNLAESFIRPRFINRPGDSPGPTSLILCLSSQDHPVAGVLRCSVVAVAGRRSAFPGLPAGQVAAITAAMSPIQQASANARSNRKAFASSSMLRSSRM